MISGTFQKLRPLTLLSHICNCYDTTFLKVCTDTVSWLIYVQQGQIIYASHSVEPFDRLECHLRRFSQKTPTITSEIRAQIRVLFEPITNKLEDIPEYQAICWLVEQRHLNHLQAAELIEKLTREVIESFLLIKQGTYALSKLNKIPIYCKLNFEPLLANCQQQLKAWQTFAPQVWSPYQRPYLLKSEQTQQQLPPEVNRKLTAILKGFSLRHLAVLLNQEELQLAQSLYPYIINGNILLQPPYIPFDQLPFTQVTQNTTPATATPVISNDANTVQLPQQATAAESKTPNAQAQSDLEPPLSTRDKQYKLVCVDDSPTILEEMKRFLNDESFAVFTITDPIKALMQIIRIKPDLILLDVRMAGIDGYELCRLLRNHSLFKNTPIVMVTGNTGIIDRVKARFVGASGYLTKPFTQSQLLKMVFRHLS